ncbi:hypothetical protein D3C81_1331400 [compost metagenome]
MSGHRVEQQATVEVVVDLAFGGGAAVVAGGEVAGVKAVGAVIAAVEVAQVGLQHARADRPIVHQAQEVLFVEVFQVAVVVLQQQVLAELVVASAIVELVAEVAGARVVGAADGHAFFVGRITALDVFYLAADQGQILDFIGGDLAALEGLRQQAPIVIGDDRQLGHECAVAQFGLREPGLGGQAKA